MPLDMNKGYVTKLGSPNEKMTLAEMEAEFNAELLKQQQSGMTGGWGMNKPKIPEATLKKITELQDKITNMLEQTIIDSLNLGIIEYSVEEDAVYLTHDIFSSSGEMGYFLEEELFNLREDTSKPTADFDRFRTMLLPDEERVELKALTGIHEDIDIGKITVYGLEKELTEAERAKIGQIAAIYKAMKKMQNLLYISVRQGKSPSGKDAVSFNFIILYSILYLEGLKKIIDKQMGWRGAIKAEKLNFSYDNDTHAWKRNLDIRASLAFNGLGLLKSIKKLQMLYLAKKDLLNEIETGGVSASRFFGKLRKLDVAAWMKFT